MKLSDVIEYIDMQIVQKFQLNRLRIAEVTEISVSFPFVILSPSSPSPPPRTPTFERSAEPI